MINTFIFTDNNYKRYYSRKSFSIYFNVGNYINIRFYERYKILLIALIDKKLG